MKSAENIKAMVKKLRFAAGNEMDRRIWHGILEAQEEHESKITAQREGGVWRMIMKHRIAKPAAIAAIVIVGVLVARTQLKDSTGPTQDLGRREIAKQSEPENSVGRTGDTDRQQSRPTATTGDLSLAQRVARSSAIVRATLEEVTDECSRWRVKKVLFGDVEKPIVDLIYFPAGGGSMQDFKRALENAAGRNLATEEIWEEFRRIRSGWPTLGREIILFLEERDEGYRYQGAAYDVPAINSIDDFEQRLLGVIESGEYKSEPGGRINRL
ncbi:MAG: hypothetical protein ACYS8Z_01460 [Planctomycetota bacterium]|jgi:hypothetical protein